MSNKPLWHNNVLAFFPAVMEQLKSMPNVRGIYDSKDWSQFVQNRQKPHDNAVYVILDSINPRATNNHGREQDIEIGISVIYVKQSITLTPQLELVGETWTAIMHALQGFEPSQEGRALTLTPLVQTTALPIRYADGFAYYPLRFITSVAVVNPI